MINNTTTTTYPYGKKSILKTLHTLFCLSHILKIITPFNYYLLIKQNLKKKLISFCMDLYVEESIHVTTIFKNIQNYELKNLLLHSIYKI